MKKTVLFVAYILFLLVVLPLFVLESEKKSSDEGKEEISIVIDVNIDNDIPEEQKETEEKEETITEKKGYTTAPSGLNIRISPDMNSEVLHIIPYNQEILYVPYNSEWHKVSYRGINGYSYNQYVSDFKVSLVKREVVVDEIKSWESYTSITDKTSAQYELQQKAHTDYDTGIRMVCGRYCIALGSYYTQSIGQFVDIITESGDVIPCILGDQKDDKDTDSNNMYHVCDNSTIEFIVDSDFIKSHERQKVVYLTGDVSSLGGIFKSKAVEVQLYVDNALA